MKRKTQSRNSARSPAVFDMSSNICVWSKAGVIKPTRCINAFDCLSCPLHKRLKKDVATGRLTDGRAPVGWQDFPVHQATQAEQMKCRHMLSGRVSYKYCINNYQCDSCPYNEMMEDEALADFQDHSVQKIVSGFALAENYYYHPGHTWARVEYGGFVRMGLDDFTARVFGPFDRIALPDMGTALRQGDTCCEVIRGSLQAGCLCPIEGVVVAVNPRASAKESFPEWEPFDAGWLVVIEPVHLTSRLRRLHFGEESFAWMEQEATALTSMIAEETGHAVAATGGRAMPDIYGHLPELDWNELKHRFLHT